MATLLSVDAFRKHREALREAGMRPVQFRVSDSRAQQFVDECRRQCLLVVQADAADTEALDGLDAAQATASAAKAAAAAPSTAPEPAAKKHCAPAKPARPSKRGALAVAAR